MYKINCDIIDRMLSSSDEAANKKIIIDIKLLIDYAKHVSIMDERIKELIQKGDRASDYTIISIEKQRREKHDMAIQCLYELNEISCSMGLDKVYSGGFEESNRGDIAQAIFEFCKYYFAKY